MDLSGSVGKDLRKDHWTERRELRDLYEHVAWRGRHACDRAYACDDGDHEYDDDAVTAVYG